jgi:hypothetical protein
MSLDTKQLVSHVGLERCLLTGKGMANPSQMTNCKAEGLPHVLVDGQSRSTGKSR